jgi:hypothetical protein
MKKAFYPIIFIAALMIIASCVKPRTDNINYYNNNLDTTLSTNKGLTINEFCAHSPTYLDSDGGLPAVANHWVELYNAGSATINFDTSQYYMSDDSTNPSLFKLYKFSISPKSYMLVMTDSPQLADVTHMHANFHTSKSGGFLGLYYKSGSNYIPLTRHAFNAQTSAYSEGRYPDNGSTWYDFAVPTPLAPNSTSGGFTLSATQ